MPGMPRRSIFTAVSCLAVVAVLAAGCTGERGDEEAPPDAEALLASAADEMAQVDTVRLHIGADTALADLPVREADAVVTRAGDAQGSAQIEQFGQVLELEFVLAGDTFYYQLIGPWLELPREKAAEYYDPTAILDPERGVAHLLRNADQAEVRGTGDAGGVDAYEVGASFAAADLAALLPGVPEQVDGTLWIGQERPLLHRAEFSLPGGTVTVELSDFDAPVEIRAP